MAKDIYLSHFTPSMLDPETLEKILIGRGELADKLVELIIESATTGNKHYSLLVGPRGIGKTHLVSLVYHRVEKNSELKDRLMIAWLREEEWGVASFLDLLLRVLRAVGEEYDDRELAEKLEDIHKLTPEEAEHEAERLLLDRVAGKTLLIIVENLDEIFKGLEEEGQKKLRALIQNNPVFTLLATSQSLFSGVTEREEPFFGFFETHHLSELTFEQAVALLSKVAGLQETPEGEDLVKFIGTPQGRARIRAIHHLAAGNPRVYIIFSQFLTRRSLNDLIEPVMQTLDDLTPYYQSRMSYISPQQRKIVEFLCERRGAVTVAEIARHSFISHQTASSQLKKLRDYGYAFSHEIGRESLYELREPLMRIVMEVKKFRGEPIRLFVDFMRLWYSKTELSELLESLPETDLLERPIITRALKLFEIDPVDSLVPHYKKELSDCIKNGNFDEALSLCEDLIERRGSPSDYWEYAKCLKRVGRFKEVEEAEKKVDEFSPANFEEYLDKADALFGMGKHEQSLENTEQALKIKPNDMIALKRKAISLGTLSRFDEAFEGIDKAMDIDSNDSIIWLIRGLTLINLGKLKEALASFDKSLELDSDDSAAWKLKGLTLSRMGQNEAAIISYEKALEIDPKDSSSLVGKGNALIGLERFEESIATNDIALKLDPQNSSALNSRANAFLNLGRYEEAAISCDKALKSEPDNSLVWTNRGAALLGLGRSEEAIASCDKALMLNSENSSALNNRGAALHNLGQYEEAIVSYDKAIEVDPEDYSAWNNRGKALRNLGRHDEAVASYDNALKIEPENFNLWISKWEALDRIGRYEEAFESSKKALELEREVPVALAIVAIGFYRLGMLPDSLQMLEKLITIQPESDVAWSNHAVALNSLGRHEEALTSFDKAIKLDPENVDFHIISNRAMTLMFLNRWDEGRLALDEALPKLAEDLDEGKSDDIWIVSNLLIANQDRKTWVRHIEVWVELFAKHGLLGLLGQGLTNSIRTLKIDWLTDEMARTWLEVWSELAGGYKEMELPLRFLDAAVRYYADPDPRILLRLAAEERSILEEIMVIPKE